MTLGQHFNKTTALNGKYGTNSMNEIEGIWINKETGQAVLVLRFFNYMVSYQENGFIKQMGDFEFRDHFKKDEITI